MQFTEIGGVVQLAGRPPEPAPYLRCTGSVPTGSSNWTLERRLYVVCPGRPRFVVIRIAPAPARGGGRARQDLDRLDVFRIQVRRAVGGGRARQYGLAVSHVTDRKSTRLNS